MADVDLRRVEALFHAAADLPAGERGAYLSERCRGEDGLRRQVEILLERAEHDLTLAPPIPEPGPYAPLRVIAALSEGPGALIGHYKLLQVIGEGGFGVVYMAEQQEPVVRRVALKIIKLGMDTREVVARFEAERQALALMDHPNIAMVLDGGATASGRPYFVMELVRGLPITEYCDSRELTTRERLELLLQVCHAVQHAHQKGIIHRDIKPSNVLVAPQDGGATPKIIDFGVAKAIHGRLTDKTLFTRYEQFLGTPAYMSPEQAEMSPMDVDTRSDIYSLGVLLYELLTGTTPFDTTTLKQAGLAEIRRIIREEQPPRPSLRAAASPSAAEAARRRKLDVEGLSRRLRGDLDWIVMKCLEKSRSRRYDSAEALAADLQRYLKHEPVLAGPPSASYRAAKFVRRHRVGVIATLAVGVALVGCIVAIGWGLAEAVHGRKRAEELTTAAQRARDESEEVTRFLAGMIESVQPDESGRDVTVVEVLGAASMKVATAFADRPEVEARLRHALGISYWQLGRLDDAEKHLPVALELQRKALGQDHLQTLRTTANLASLRLAQGRTNEAEELLRVAVDGLTRTLGPDHAMTLGALNNLARVHVHARQAPDEEALALHRRVFEGQRRVQGPEHPHTLGALLNLADLLMDMNRLDEAEPLMRQAVAAWERGQGADHPGTLQALHNLAMLESKRMQFDEAESTMGRVIEARGRVLGERHYQTLSAAANLGSIVLDRGDGARAETITLGAWEGLRATLGDSHPTTIQVALMLMKTIAAQDWPEASQGTVVRVVEMARFVADRADLPVAALNDLAWMLSNARPAVPRDHHTALALASRACEMERSAGGTNLWNYLDTLAAAQNQTGDRAAATATQREALRLVPPTASAAERAGMEEHLREYERAAAGK